MSDVLLSACIVFYLWLGCCLWRDILRVDKAVDPLEASICPLHHDRTWRRHFVFIVFVGLWPFWLALGMILNRISRAS